MVDAPVSGGVPAAADATLTFIVGGTSEGMERARPLLLSMGSKTIHCGEAGTGCIAKVSCIVSGHCILRVQRCFPCAMDVPIVHPMSYLTIDNFDALFFLSYIVCAENRTS